MPTQNLKNAKHFLIFRHPLQNGFLLMGLICSLINGLTLRAQTASSLRSNLLLTNDAYRFIQQTEIILEKGGLPEIDIHRWVPLGRDLTSELNLFPYVMAFLYKTFFFPYISIHTLFVYYPLFCYVISSILLFFITRRLFGAPTALVTLSIASVHPAGIVRSAAGYGDRDALCLMLYLLSFYLYIRAIDSYTPRGRVSYGVISGFVMMVLGLLWQGVGLFISVIVLTDLGKFVLHRYEKHDFQLYISWFLPILAGLTFLTPIYRNHLNMPVAILTLVIPTTLGVFSFLYTLFYKPNRYANQPIKRKTHRAKTTYLVVLASMAFLFLSFFLWQLQADFVLSIIDNIISPFGRSRLAQSIAELNDYSLYIWIQTQGWLFYLFVGGALIFLYEISCTLGMNPWIPLGFFQIFLATIFYGEFIPVQNIADWAPLFAGVTFFTAFMASYLYQYNQGSSLSKREFNYKRPLLFFWFLTCLVCTRGAQRFEYFLTPVLAILAAYTLTWLCKAMESKDNAQSIVQYLASVTIYWTLYVIVRHPVVLVISLGSTLLLLGKTCMLLLREQKHKYLKAGAELFLAGMLVGITSLVEPAGGYALRSSSLVETVKSPTLPHHEKTYDWMARNLPVRTVVAAWWDYGSQLNNLGKMSTILDEDQYVPYWIHLMARYAICAKNEKEALEFLKTHQARYLYFTERDFWNLPTISALGSDERFDRYAPLTLLTKTSEIDGKSITLVPLNQPKVRLKLNGRSYSWHEWDLQAVHIPIRDLRDLNNINAKVVSRVQNRKIELPIQHLYFEGKEITNPRGFPGGIYLIRQEQNTRKVWKAIYLSEQTQSTLFVRLFLLGEESRHFKLIYPNASIGQVSGILPTKIWQIVYPKDTEINPAYLEKRFQSTEMYKAWKGGQLEPQYR